MNGTNVKLVDGVHVGDKVSGFGLLGQCAGEQFVVVQIVDDKEETLEASVGLSEELDIVPQFGKRNVGKGGEELLSGRVQLEMPLIFSNRKND